MALHLWIGRQPRQVHKEQHPIVSLSTLESSREELLILADVEPEAIGLICNDGYKPHKFTLRGFVSEVSFKMLLEQTSTADVIDINSEKILVTNDINRLSTGVC